MTHIIVPIKDLSQAKQRLAGVLSKEHREGLVLAMLEDLLITLSTLPSCTVWVIASNPKVFQVAQRCGAQIINEHESQGYNQAVAFGLKQFAGEPIAVIPGDVPLASAVEILQLIKPTDDQNELVRLAPDTEQQGTNGLFLSRANLMEPGFGSHSYMRYLSKARAKGIGVENISSANLALDIDTPADLEQLVSHVRKGATYEFLQQLGHHFGPQFLDQGAA
ncbi:2-phospho-L-lactate guanylyltransferase [Candidatus Njordibacter sp. Uisw_039]|mgnify:CR=1 FL=1|jgi:2-phospho-L-lactate guanylyltransferase|uniref:2-phospho-L-lactate guanylyltransferase n=1 Tax=Candidatus Njordibacter sp. Uisw_039 TaxID=3230972 RepID=UPI0035910688|tara:strand:+ start:6541 stop:7203 length:663 start_codon:yes stop_codon:yes gene_type:complete